MHRLHILHPRFHSYLTWKYLGLVYLLLWFVFLNHFFLFPFNFTLTVNFDLLQQQHYYVYFQPIIYEIGLSRRIVFASTFFYRRISAFLCHPGLPGTHEWKLKTPDILIFVWRFKNKNFSLKEIGYIIIN